ncbi:hypothetical protein NQ176_g5423 [Zarea fungicola]|uniref:Uncharacterized protein n=1 Tax=Zarea fungicola TaxID=93591 RepID=A0ACC1N9D9_9HYPO|nr:hypothetical protein NQ176_g5423 [Lecanicillium fungicola]
MRFDTTIALLTAAIASTQFPLIPGVSREILSQHNISIPNHDTIQALVHFGCEASFPRHTHPGEEVIYVRDGVLEYTIDGQHPVVLKGGDNFFIPAGVVHSVRNLSKKNSTELATYILQSDKPVITYV